MLEYNRIRRVDAPNGKKRNKRIRYVAYTKEEADANGIKYVYWKDVKKNDKDIYVLTDDGYVGLLERVTMAINKKTERAVKFVYTNMGGCIVSVSNQLNLLQNIQSNEWVLSRKTRYQKHLKAKNIKSVTKIVALFIYNGTTYDWDLLEKIYKGQRFTQYYNKKRSIQQLLKKREVKKMIAKNLAELLEARGLNKEFIADMTKKVMEQAFEDKEYGRVLEGAKMAANWLRMGSEVRTVNKLMETTTIKQIDDTIQNAKRERILEQKTISDT